MIRTQQAQQGSVKADEEHGSICYRGERNSWDQTW